MGGLVPGPPGIPKPWMLLSYIKWRSSWPLVSTDAEPEDRQPEDMKGQLHLLSGPLEKRFVDPCDLGIKQNM